MFPKAINVVTGDQRVSGLKYLTHNQKLVLDASKCIGCGDCVLVCPKNALSQKIGSETSYPTGKAPMPVMEDPHKCSYCGVCAYMCSFDAITLLDDDQAQSLPDLQIVKKRALPELVTVAKQSKKTQQPIRAYMSGTIALNGSVVAGAAAKRCADMCPTGALSWENELKLNADDCIFCGACKNVEPAEGLIELKRSPNIRGAYNEILWKPIVDSL